MNGINSKEEIMLSIGDVAKFLGIPTHTLRYWEKEFSSYLTPQRTNGKHRRYSDRDVEVIKEIKRLLKDDGYSLVGVKKLLQYKGITGVNSPKDCPYYKGCSPQTVNDCDKRGTYTCLWESTL